VSEDIFDGALPITHKMVQNNRKAKRHKIRMAEEKRNRKTQYCGVQTGRPSTVVYKG
jgi:hypothetical protein